MTFFAFVSLFAQDFLKSLVTFCLSQNDMYNEYGSGYLSKHLRISLVDKKSLTRTKRLFRGQKVPLTNTKASRGQQDEVPSTRTRLNQRSLKMQYLRGFRRQRCPGNSMTLTPLWTENLKRCPRRKSVHKGNHETMGYPLVLPD